MLIVPNSSEVIIMGYMLNLSDPQDLVMRLFTNNIVPGPEDTVESFTEAATGGYRPIDLVPSSWTITAGEPSEATHRQVIWEFDGPAGNIFGYYVTRKQTGEIMWAERFKKAPFSADTKGDQIRITPRIKLINRAPARR